MATRKREHKEDVAAGKVQSKRMPTRHREREKDATTREGIGEDLDPRKRTMIMKNENYEEEVKPLKEQIEQSQSNNAQIEASASVNKATYQNEASNIQKQFEKVQTKNAQIKADASAKDQKARNKSPDLKNHERGIKNHA